MAKRIPIEYLLEIEVGEHVIRSMILPPVISCTPTLQPATDFRWTFGERPVKQKMGYREGQLSIRGQAGYKRRTGKSANGPDLTALGPKLFSEFVLFMVQYEELGANTEGPIKRDESLAPRLIFRSQLEAGTPLEAWYVEVTRFSAPRDESQRLTLSYSLDLRIEGPVVRKSTTKFGGVAQKLDASKNLGDSMAEITSDRQLGKGAKDRFLEPGRRLGEGARDRFPEGVGIFAGSGGRAAVQLSSLSDFLRDVPVRWSQFRAPVEDLMQFAQNIQKVAGAVKAQFAFPKNMVNDLANLARTSIETLEASWDALPGSDRVESREWFDKAYGSIEKVRSDALTIVGLSREKITDTSSVRTSIDSRVTSKNGTAVTCNAMRGNENLQQFCARVLQDAGRWRFVMYLNDMASPFFSKDGLALGSGLDLLVPILPGVPLNAKQTQDLFGTDLLFRDGTLVLNGTTDFALVRGKANLIQAVTRRLLAKQGSNLAFPLWGMPKLVGEAGIAGLVGMIASKTREQMESDSRIAKVIDLVVENNADTYEARFKIITTAGDSQEIVVVS